jgi:hypothetical protein
MGRAAVDPAYERALASEIAASELLRMRVIAVTPAISAGRRSGPVPLCAPGDRAVSPEAGPDLAAFVGHRVLPRL